MLQQNRGGNLLHKTRISKFVFHFLDFAFCFFDFFGQTRPLRRVIDQTGQWQVQLTQFISRHRRSLGGTPFCAYAGQCLCIQEQSNHFDFLSIQPSRRAKDERYPLVGGDIRLRLKIPAQRYQAIFGRCQLFRRRIQAKIFLFLLGKRLGPCRPHDGLASTVRRKVVLISESVPQLFGDERQEGMKQAKRVPQNKIDNRHLVLGGAKISR